MGDPRAAPSRQEFIGRVMEIAHLRAGLDDVRLGQGRLILVSGPPGIGKSRLVAEFTRMAGQEGIPVLVGRSWEAGGAPAFWPWTQVIRSYLRVTDQETVVRRAGSCIGDVATLVPELAELLEEPVVNGTEGAGDRFRLFDSTTTFLRSMAQDQPVVVVLEDLQAADVPSLLLLQFMAGEVADSRLLVVATYRDVELAPDHALTPVLGELNRLPATTVLLIPGLDAEESARFLEASSGTRPSEAVVRSLHRQTGGNPLFLREAIRLLSDPSAELEGPPGGRTAMPAEIRAVIERRLGGLAPATREVLEVGSVFGNRFQLEWLRRHGERPAEEILERLEEAMAAELVVERGGGINFRFSHDLIRHSLYAGLAPSRRVRLHRRAADILEEVHGGDLDDHLATIAYHHFEAGPGGDRERAVEYGRRAGDHALRSLAYEEAVRFYQMALGAAEDSDHPDPTTRMDLLLSLGDARVRAGELPGAEDAFFRAAEIARGLGDGRRLAKAAVGYGGRFIWSRAGADTRMIPLLQDALVMLGGEDDSLRARLLSRLACALRGRADPDHLDALSRQAVDLARSIDDPHALIYALAARAGAIWWPENPEERLAIGDELVEIGERTGTADGPVDGYVIRLVALTEMGQINAARRQFEDIIRIGDALRLPAHHWLEGATRALLALLEGDLDAVEPRIEDLRHRAPTTPARDNVSAALFQLFLLRREQDRLGEVEAVVRQAAGDFPWYPIHRLALALLLAEEKRESEAGRILTDLAADRFSGLSRDNYWVPSMCLAAELAVVLGDRETATTVYELLQPYTGRIALGFPEGSLGSVARYLGLAAGSVGELDDAELHLEAAEAAHRRMGARPWLAHTLYDRAQVRIQRGRAGDADRAAALLAESHRLCGQVGLVRLQRKVDAAMEGMGQVSVPNIADPQPGVFVREGDYFSVAFSGDAFRIRDSKGMRYLAALLTSPGREIHVLDLVAGIEGVDPASRGQAEAEFTDAGGGHSEPLLDAAAREAYKRRLAELEEDIAEADSFGDSERASQARQEHEFLASELAAAVGLGGRDRTAASAAERARVNVTRAVRTALKRVAAHSPRLGAHLDATIRTGVFCSYTPDPRAPITWKV